MSEGLAGDVSDGKPGMTAVATPPTVRLDIPAWLMVLMPLAPAERKIKMSTLEQENYTMK